MERVFGLLLSNGMVTWLLRPGNFRLVAATCLSVTIHQDYHINWSDGDGFFARAYFYSGPRNCRSAGRPELENSIPRLRGATSESYILNVVTS